MRLEKPFHVHCYEILRAHTLEQVVQVVSAGQRACSANFLIGQTPDRVVDIEAAPARVAVWTPEHSILVHTNHFLLPQALGVVEQSDEERFHTYT